MTVKECYEIMKGDYNDVLARYKSDDKIKKVLVKIVDDPSFAALCNALAAKNVEEAYRAALALKSASKNMSLDGLAYSASNLSEALKDRTSYDDDIEPLFKKLKKDYALTMACIQML